MGPKSKEEYTEVIVKRYKKADRKQKTLILDEFCETCGYHRKWAIQKINTFKFFTKPKPKKRGKPSTYNNQQIIQPLKKIWLAANLPCSKRLKVILPIWLPFYHREFGHLSIHVTQKLLKISPPTIDRILKPTRIKYKHRGRCTTKPGSLLRKQIPIKTNQWDETRPGFLEADTVAHCGTTTLGQYANTLNFTDIATGWTEQRAIWGKGELVTLTQIKHVESLLPFPLLGFDADNGGEFLNYHLFRHFTKQRKRPIQFTRSRAYQKNDNAHVEQKNWTHVRQWLGYYRFDRLEIVPLLNDLYVNEWRLFHNFFLPSVKLIEKTRIGSKIKKRLDAPKTPYQRLLKSPYIDSKTKRKLKEQYESLNPFYLRKQIERKLKKVFDAVFPSNS